MDRFAWFRDVGFWVMAQYKVMEQWLHALKQANHSRHSGLRQQHFLTFGSHHRNAGVKMKFNSFVTSDQSKNHESHFNETSHIHRKTMSSLSKELRQKYSTVFNPCPFERMMKFNLCEDIKKGSKLAKEFRFIGRNMSSTLNEHSERKLMIQLFKWAFTPARWISLD